MPNVLYVVWILVGGGVAIEGYRIGLGSFSHPGPGFLIFIAALFLFFFGVVDLAGGVFGKFKKKEILVWSDIRWGKIAFVLTSLLSYVFLLNYLGFLLPTFLLMFLLFKFVEPTRWWIALGAAALATGAAYLIFKILLNVPFPSGVWGF